MAAVPAGLTVRREHDLHARMTRTSPREMHHGAAMNEEHASSSPGVTLVSLFHNGSDGPGGWWIIFEPEPHLGDDIGVPESCRLAPGGMPDFPDSARANLAPDRACGVLSPSTHKLDAHEGASLHPRRRRASVVHRPAARTPQDVRTP